MEIASERVRGEHSRGVSFSFAGKIFAVHEHVVIRLVRFDSKRRNFEVVAQRVRG